MCRVVQLAQRVVQLKMKRKLRPCQSETNTIAFRLVFSIKCMNVEILTFKFIILSDREDQLSVKTWFSNFLAIIFLSENAFAVARLEAFISSSCCQSNRRRFVYLVFALQIVLFTLLQEWWLVLENFQRPNNINSTMMKFSGSTMEFVLFSLKYIFKPAFMFTEVKTKNQNLMQTMQFQCSQLCEDCT